MTILDLFYPMECPLCGTPVRKREKSYPFCIKCEAEYAELSIRGTPDFHDVLPENTELYCACTYSGVFREAVIRYKFQEEIWLADPFAELLHRRIDACGGYQFCDIITYVPISGQRMTGRGYDQTFEIVKGLHKRSCLPAVNSFLRKDDREDMATSKKNRSERSAQSRYTYIGNEQEIKEQSILLVDDILTTGSTLRECTTLLLSHGALCVKAAVLASGRKDI